MCRVLGVSDFEGKYEGLKVKNLDVGELKASDSLSQICGVILGLVLLL